MKSFNKLAGLGLAAIAAASFAFVSSAHAAWPFSSKNEDGRCYGVAATDTTTSQTDAKGQTYVKLSKKDCTDKGGTWQSDHDTTTTGTSSSGTGTTTGTTGTSNSDANTGAGTSSTTTTTTTTSDASSSLNIKLNVA